MNKFSALQRILQQTAGRHIIRSRNLTSLEALNSGITISKPCVKRIKTLNAQSGNDLFLRVLVDPGGCSGFQYKFEMDNEVDEEADSIFERDGVKVVVDETSLQFIAGSTIEYEQELIRSAFAVVNNPQSESACGCGSSFAVKNFAENSAMASTAL